MIGNWDNLLFSLQPKGAGAKTVAIVTAYYVHHVALFLSGLLRGQVWLLSLFYFQRYFWFCDRSSDGTTDDVINLLICLTQKLKYLWKERRYFKMENTILHDFEMSFEINYLLFRYHRQLKCVLCKKNWLMT